MKTIPHGIDDLQFMIFNQEADDWYNPLKPYTKLEYEWIRDNLELEYRVVVDAGCHHGNYSVVFKPAYVIAIDVDKKNCLYAMQNMKMNEMNFEIQRQALGRNGANIILTPDIYKCDIEGYEFELFPSELQRFPSVSTWIIELHPNAGNPNDIAILFDDDWELLKVDRAIMRIRKYEIGKTWKEHSTLIARKYK